MDLDPDPSPINTSSQTANSAETRSKRIGRYLQRLKTVLKFSSTSSKTARRHGSTDSGLTDKVNTLQPQFDPSISLKDVSQYKLDLPFRESTDQLLNPLQDVTAGDNSNEPLQPSSLIDKPSDLADCWDPRMQRAANLFWRYGFDLDSESDLYRSKSLSPRDIKRVEKPILMRVHHHCHHCSVEIGPHAVCVNCGHKLCKKCHRHPSKKPVINSSEPIEKKRKAPSPTRSETLDNWLAQSSSPAVTTKPATIRESAPHETFVTKRLRMICHICSTMFNWFEKRCHNCDHIMCSECLRGPTEAVPPPDPSYDPSISPPQPFQGRILKRPRLRFKYTCEQCSSEFQELSHTCTNCGHTRCGNCIRNPPRRNFERGHNPHILGSLRRQLGGFSVPNPPPTDGSEI